LNKLRISPIHLFVFEKISISPSPTQVALFSLPWKLSKEFLLVCFEPLFNDC